MPLRLDSPEQLRCPLLSSLRCQLALPTRLSSPSCKPSGDAPDAISLLATPAFRQRSGNCLSALLRVPVTATGRRILGCCHHFPALRRLSIADCPCPQRVDGRMLLDSPLPSSLHSLELCSGLLWASRHAGWQPPASLRRLVQRSSGDLSVGHATLCPCPAHVARAARTATVHLSALRSAACCRRLDVAARWVVLSSSEAAHVRALLEPGWANPLQPLHLDGVLVAWLAVLASALGGSSIARLELTASELSLYSQPCGRMAKLPLPRWRQPGEQHTMAHGLQAHLHWPVASQGPARFALTVSKLPG